MDDQLTKEKPPGARGELASSPEELPTLLQPLLGACGRCSETDYDGESNIADPT